MLNIDEQATIKKTKLFFKNYSRYVRLANRDDNSEVCQSASKILIEIDECVDDIDNELYRFILRNRFIKHSSIKDIAGHIGLSRSRYNDHQNYALLAFAESFIPENLIVLKGGGSHG